jgi:hypothetical protein
MCFLNEKKEIVFCMCFFGKQGGGKKTKKLFISDFWEKGEKKDFIFIFIFDKKVKNQ